MIDHILDISTEKTNIFPKNQVSTNENQDLILYLSKCAIKPIEIAIFKDLL
jgi:hypothetical protein